MVHWLFEVSIFILALMPVTLWSDEKVPAHIGAILPLTGAGSFMGQDLRDGMTLCSEGKIPIKYEDHQGQASLGALAFNKLVDSDKINFAIVSYSNAATAIIPIAKSKKIPLLLTLVSSSKLSDSFGEDMLNYFSTGEQEAPILAEYCIKKLGIKKAAVLYVEGEYGLCYRDPFVSAFEKQGGTVVTQESFLPDEKDFRTQLLRLKSSGTEFIYLAAYDHQYLNILRQAKTLGIKTRMGGNWTLAAPNVHRGNEDILDGVLFTSPEFYISDRIELHEFKNHFQEHFGHPPSAYAGIGCDIGHLLLSFGSSPSTSLIEKLKNLRNHEGIMGKLSTVGGKYIQFPLIPCEYKSGKIKVLD